MITTLLAILVAGQGAKLDLHLMTSGAMPKIGFYIPQRLPLMATPSNGVKALDGATAEYGTLEFGGKKIAVAEVSENGAPSKILFDFTGTAGFVNAASFDWKVRTMDPKNPDSKLYQAEVSVPSPFGEGGNVSMSFYRFNPADKQRAALKDTLLYYGNYALDGTATLAGKDFHVMIADTTSKGEFGAPSSPGNPTPATMLLIDRNGDGKFSQPYETFDANKPFNIGGTTYELSMLHGNGNRAEIRQSSKMVAEIPIPPSLNVGSKVIAFTATDVNGKTVHFPQDFKGKVVMLDFWATWCGPCMGEVPNVVKTYNQLHGNGFEILGISLDNKDTLKNLAPVTKQQGMTWNQVADGKFWDAEIAKLYGIRSIPAAYIVDGDTGMIYAEGEAIRGDRFQPAVQKALDSKGKAPK